MCSGFGPKWTGSSPPRLGGSSPADTCLLKRCSTLHREEKTDPKRGGTPTRLTLTSRLGLPAWPIQPAKGAVPRLVSKLSCKLAFSTQEETGALDWYRSKKACRMVTPGILLLPMTTSCAEGQSALAAKPSLLITSLRTYDVNHFLVSIGTLKMGGGPACCRVS